VRGESDDGGEGSHAMMMISDHCLMLFLFVFLLQSDNKS
jgi:hypothetical protein